MSTFLYTSGPWAWRWKSDALHQVGTPPYSYGACIMTLRPEDDGKPGISDADAALIEAAPLLLEALQLVLPMAQNWADGKGRSHPDHDCIEEALNAITVATSQGNAS